MKRYTIKWRIFKYNLVIIGLLITLVAFIFNVAIKIYIENDISSQLNKIANRTEDTALRKGPGFFPGPRNRDMPPPNDGNQDVFRFYFMLDRSLREPLSLLNADFILFDSDKKIIDTTPDDFLSVSDDLVNKISDEVNKISNINNEKYLNFNFSGTDYVAIIKPVSQKNTFRLGYIIIFSNLQKVNQLQLVINIILLSILLFSAIIIVIFSQVLAKKISAPFSLLNTHIRAIAERNFGNKVQTPVYEELQEFVNSINIMADKLDAYDKAQKTFLQNASHEFRTPLMSIQSYAEGIKYEVVDSETAVEVIVEETKRMTHLVEDVLYLSRLDTLEESYNFEALNFIDLINDCFDRMNGIAIKSNIKLSIKKYEESIDLYADYEKLSRGLTNIISNCIRYAKNEVTLEVQKLNKTNIIVTISDDGPGMDENELPKIFERFFKGKKGVFGLGLAISKDIIEKHKGKVSAKNTEVGALFTIELHIVSHH